MKFLWKFWDIDEVMDLSLALEGGFSPKFEDCPGVQVGRIRGLCEVRVFRTLSLALCVTPYGVY